MPQDQASPVQPESLEDYEAFLTKTLGAMVGGRQLAQALGYPSADAFKKARRCGRLPLDTFSVPGRHGRFVLTKDFAAWLWRCRQG